MELKSCTIQSGFSERASFFMRFIQSPRQIGSIAPSSRFLAEKMIKPIDWKKTRFIAELGAGTGAFTKYIHLLKQENCKVAIFEKDDYMREDLCLLYPKFSYFKDAIGLSKKVQSIDMDLLDVVISGLPFALFEETAREIIINEVIRSLKPNGIFVAFQYSLQMKKLLSSKFSQVDISFVPLNIPPAFVYVCHK